MTLQRPEPSPSPSSPVSVAGPSGGATEGPYGLTPPGAMLAFAAAVFVFHQLPALLPARAGDLVDLLTPFAVIGTSAALLRSARAHGATLVVALAAAILYVDGHGIHLSANSIHNLGPRGEVERAAYFWDERFSHVESLLGWFGLVGAFCWAQRQRRSAAQAGSGPKGTLVAAALLLGFTFFTSTVEGQTWPLLLATAPLFLVWAARSRRPLVVAAAAAFGLAVVLVGVWAILNGGVPEFSDTGLI